MAVRFGICNELFEGWPLERVLTYDPGMAVIRHADAGYPEAIQCAKTHGVKIPMME